MSDSQGPANSQSISSTLLARLRLHDKHDEQAWVKLFSVWQPIVYHWCRMAGESPHDADDIVQNVFLRVSQYIHTFQRGRFRAWLRSITRHAIADRHREHNREPVGFGGSGSWMAQVPIPEEESSSEILTTVSPAAGTDGLPPDSQPEERFLLYRLVELVRNEVEEFTYKAFRRTAMEGGRPVDVAKELGTTPEAVRSAKYRFLKRLREEREAMR